MNKITSNKIFFKASVFIMENSKPKLVNKHHLIADLDFDNLKTAVEIDKLKAAV